jgi:DNA-binding NtrC family response regulator
MTEPGSPSKQPQPPGALPEVLGESVGITNLRAQVAHLLGRQGHGRRLPTLLIQGETGTGKGLLARALHQASIRADRPFVDIDCAAIPETLLESELFGVERGAFTDARQTKLGLFQTASGGTIFLDEVGLLPRSLQGKLLKVVEERGVRRLGSTHTEMVDLWVLAATNIDLKAAARDGSFRQDLYHRLAAVTLMIPPLRARDGDILLLAEHFLARACTEYRLPPKALAPDAQAAMLAYAWPGNVRELANMLERVVLLSGEDTVISAELLALPAAPATPPMRSAHQEPPRLRSLVEGFERDRLVEALRGARGNITAAAARLGLPRNTLRYRMCKLGIGAEEPGETTFRPSKPLAKMSAISAESDPPVRPVASAGRAETRLVSLLRAELREAEGQPGQTDRVLELIAAKVQSFGGRIEAINGSRLLATFGVYPCEEAASRAAHTAIAVARASARTSALGLKPAAGQLAIHACEASVRRVKGSFVMDEEHRKQAEGVLDTLLSSTEPDGMLVSQSAARLLRERFDLEPATAATGAGSAFYLVGHHWPGRGLRQPSLTPFVGREHELALLERLFARAEAGRGQVVGIVGEPGAGKSRLLHEFRQRLTGREVAYRAVKYVPYGRGTADLTGVEVMKQAWGIADGDDSAVIVEKVRHALESLGMDADRWAPYLLTLFGITLEADHLARLSRGELQMRVHDAIRRVAVEKSRREPLIIAMDDLQWAGNTAGEFVSYLVENLASARILLLTTYRPDYRPPWIAKSYVTQLTLPPLSRAESLAMLGPLLPEDRSADRLTDAILEKTEGNPFFLEELARSAAATEDSDVDLAVPDTVRALLVARMDRLDDGARRLLHIASVIGRRVPARLLERFCEEPTSLAECIAECKRLEFLEEEIVEGEPVYVFKHALVREVAYHGLSLIDRQALHAAAGRALESLHSDRLEELRDLLAHHYSKSM